MSVTASKSNLRQRLVDFGVKTHCFWPWKNNRLKGKTIIRPKLRIPKLYEVYAWGVYYLDWWTNRTFLKYNENPRQLEAGGVWYFAARIFTV